MAEARAETTIERSADDVWATIGTFGDMSWFPGVETCTVDGDECSAKLAGRNLEHVIRLVHRDDATRTYTYETVGFRGDTISATEDGGTVDANSITGHIATITVAPQGGSSSRVTYDVSVDSEPMGEQMRARYQSVLDSLKDALER